jgi:hypothetical protein
MSFTYKNDLVTSLVSRYNIILIMQVRQNMFRLSVSKSCPFLIHDLSLGFSQVTWRVPLMEQELLNLPEHTRIHPPLPRFCGARTGQFLIIYSCLVDHSLSFCQFIFRHCSLYFLWFTTSNYPFGIFKLLAIVMSVLWFTTSNYPFGIFNFSCNIRWMCQWSLTQ